MKTPISKSGIKAGDKIRWEGDDSNAGALSAVEYVAACDEHDQFRDGQHYLLERPAPKVELPTEPTLGWLTGIDWSGRLGLWERDEDWLRLVDSDGDTAATHVPAITAFTPATAVPTEALDRLREHAKSAPSPAWGRIQAFLAAVDKAGQS